MYSASFLLGRDRELAEATALVSAPQQGAGGLLLVGGEAGVGKSAFVQAVGDITWHPLWIGHCPELGETPPFGPWLDLLQDLTRAVGLPLAALPYPFGEDRSVWTSRAKARAMADWVGQPGRSLLLVLEDIRWADPGSPELLYQIAPRLGHLPVLLLATYRNEEIHRAHPLWRIFYELDRSGTRRILLERLTVNASCITCCCGGRQTLPRWIVSPGTGAAATRPLTT